MNSSYIKNIIIVFAFCIIMIGFYLFLNVFFDIPSLSQFIDQFVSIRASVLLLIAFALVNFLFIINFLHTAHIQNKAILENISEGLVVLDVHMNIVVINTVAQQMLSTSLAHAIGKRWEDVASIESHLEAVVSENQPIVHSFLNRQQIYSKEWCIRTSHGEFFPVAISISPIMSHGKVSGGIIVFRNIEKEREIDNAKNEFISLVSHQLRTPLSAVNWCTESLLAGDTGKMNIKQTEYISRINESNKRMISLVNSILDVSRIELNTFIIDPKPSDIFALIEDIVKESSYIIKTKKLVIHKHYDKSLGIINIDSRYVRMIIDNLLSNAIKYTPDKGSIDLAVVQKDTNLLITITDTGYGIPEGDTSKIFTKLFRAHNIVSKDTDGNGLGLYIIKSIVNYAGGKIWFETKENAGTTFFVTLPIHASVEVMAQ